MTSSPNTTLGHYTIISKLGAGGKALRHLPESFKEVFDYNKQAGFNIRLPQLTI